MNMIFNFQCFSYIVLKGNLLIVFEIVIDSTDRNKS